MNLLEHYIDEIHSEEPFSFVHEGVVVNMVKVKVTYTCYGITKTEEREFLLCIWKEAKENGYFWG